jgi:hypothetical protein
MFSIWTFILLEKKKKEVKFSYCPTKPEPLIAIFVLFIGSRNPNAF